MNMTSFNGVLENRHLKRPRLGPPDFYPQDPKQKEDELTSVNVKQGFINQPPFPDGEHGSGANYTIDRAKLNKSFSDILLQKKYTNTYNDSGKKRPPLTKDNFWLVPVAKNRNHVQQWIKDLRGQKSLSSLGRRVPIFTKKEEVFQTIAENQITIVRGTWYIKMTAAYNVLQAEAKNKKNRITVDLNPEWTTAICRFMRDQLSRLIDDPSMANPANPALPTIMVQSKEETERQFQYIAKVANHMFSEGMLDRHDFLSWIVETMEKIRLHGTHALSYVVPIVFKYIQDIVKNQLLSRRLAFVCCRLLNWLLSENSWGPPTPKSTAESPSGPSGPPSVPGQHQRQPSAPPTPGQPKPLSPQKGVQRGLPQNTSVPQKIHSLPPNFPEHLNDLAYFLICFVQCITLECSGALVWYPPDDPKIAGSPLDYLPAAPSSLPLPAPKQSKIQLEDKNLRSMLKVIEFDLMQRSFASEMRWSSDNGQESATGQTIKRVLRTLEALDKQQNFDRTDSIEPLYSKIFSNSTNKESSEQGSNGVGEEAVIWLLCEWAISPKRLGEHRAAVVAKILDKRQMQIENERLTEITERAKMANSSSVTSNSNPSSVTNLLSSPPPQLLVEGVELNQNENQSLAPQSMALNPMLLGNTHLFQNLLFNFLDTQAPVLENPADKEELQSFRNLVALFSELIQHDVFSHDQYVSALITRGDVVPGHISPLPIYSSNSASTNPSTMNQSHGMRRNGMGPPSVLRPASVGGPVSNKQLDIILKNEVDDDLPSSVRSLDNKNDTSDLALFSPIQNCDFMHSPEGRTERHFTDVMRNELTDVKDGKLSGPTNNPNLSQMKKPVGPIWGYRQQRHLQYLMHIPISFEDEACIHESNQRLMVLYGASRQRNEVKKAVKKISKYVCKLVQKKSVTTPDNMNSGPSSTGIPSVGGSKKSKSKSESSPPSPNVLLSRFRCLSYFDQHSVHAQAAKAILSSFTEYSADRSQTLPPMSSITLVLNLMEDGLNVSGMVQLAVQVASMLVPLESEIARKHPALAGCYTKDLALNMVSVLRHYQSYLTLNVDLTLQAFESMHAFVKQSNITNPAHCTSSDRCVLIFLYDLYCSFPYRTKHVVEMFANFSSLIKQTLCPSKIPATSNCRYEAQFLAEYIQQPNYAHPLVVARQNFHRLREATSTYKYSFVCSAIIAMCSGQPNPESLSAIATLCAEMNAQCNDLSSEWLGVLKALCCSSCTANFNDVLLSVDPADVTIRDPLALFTAILIARNCLSLEDFIQHVAIPSLLAACVNKPVHDATDAETGARLTCHILLQLFKTPAHPSQANDPTNSDGPIFYLPEAADRHLLAACQRNIVVGAVLAVLKAIVKLGDANFGGTRSLAPTDNDAGVTMFLAPIREHDDCDDFGLGLGPNKMSVRAGGSLDTASLSEFAKHAVRIICSQQWVRERCLKQIDWVLFMDQELTREQRRNLIQLICCPEEELQKLSENPKDQQTNVMHVLHRMSRWTLRQTLLELQIMLKQAGHDESLSDDIARAMIEVFKNQQVEPTKDRKSPITGLELDRSNVWLMPPLINELSSQVQAKVLNEASMILDTSQQWSKSDKDRNSKNPASLLSQQPFLTLILTCLKGQDEQRDSLLDSLQSQILMFHSEWQNGRQQQMRDSSSPRDNTMSQVVVQEALQLRLSLMGGMFDTVKNSSHSTSSVVVLLTQLINSGMVDVEVNPKLFFTVFDMIAVLLHGTLGGDSPGSGEGRKRDYMTIVKKIKKEISDGKSASLDILRRLLPVPKKETYVIACEVPPGVERQGLKIATKQKVVPWDIIEGLKNAAPLCLSWFSASKTERKELKYEVQGRLMLYHDHDDWQRPLSEYLNPPELPEEEEEKPPTPKVTTEKRRKPSLSARTKSPGSAFTLKDTMQPPLKKGAPQKKKREKTKVKREDIPPQYGGRGLNSMYVHQGLPQNSMPPMHVGLPYGNNQEGTNYNMYNSQQPMNTQFSNQNHSKHQSANIKHNLAQLLRTKSQQYPKQATQPHGGNMHIHQGVHPSTNENSKMALRTMIKRNSISANDMQYRSRQPGTMGPPMSTNMRHMNTQGQPPIGGYSNYGNTQQGTMGQMHPSMQSTGSNYNTYQSGAGQGQNYHQVMPNQSYINQTQNSGVASGYSMGNMPMQGPNMNQSTGYNVQGSTVQNQSGIMGGQQPPQYGMMTSQQGRQMTRMVPQQQMGQAQGGMMPMHGMVQNTMNDQMARQRQMMNQGMQMNSQYAQQQQTTQLVNSLRRNMSNQGSMY